MIQVSARIFPLGFLIEVDNADFNPNDFYLNGVWERFGNGRVVVGVDENDSDFNTTGKTGGSKYLHAHKHTFSGKNGAETWGYDNFAFEGTTYPTYPALKKGSAYSSTGYFQMDNAGTGDSQNLQPYITAYRWKLISYSD